MIELTSAQIEAIKASGILEKKEFIKEGQSYWYLEDFSFSESSWKNDEVEEALLSRANVYLTEQEAIDADKRRLALGTIKKFIRENNLEFTPDWENEETRWQVTGWDYNKDSVSINYWTKINDSQHNLVFESQEDLEKVLENCKEELKTLLKI